MIRVTCVNDKNKPKEIPKEKWIKKGNQYHIIYVYWHPNQGVQGVDLSEISLDGCEPFETFRLDRFAIHQDDLEKFIELCKGCTEMSDVDIEELIKETELVESL